MPITKCADEPERAFRYFDGVFKLLRFDNLKSVVKRILRGYQREETSRFIAFRSHWRFQSEFCNPGRGNEKGGVEGEGGYFRRNHWVPLPEARDLEELNAYLEQCCKQDQRRILDGRRETVGSAMLNFKVKTNSQKTELPVKVLEGKIFSAG